MKIGSHDSSSSVGFVTDITITNDVTFDFNSSKTEKEIIVITIDRTFCCYIIIPSFHTLLFFYYRPWITRAASSPETPPSRSSGKTVSEGWL